MRNNIGKTHYEQLLSYAEFMERDGSYYGNKAQYEKRHKQIVLFLTEAIQKIDSKKSANDKG